MDVTVIGGDEFVEIALSTTISQPNSHVNYSHGELSFRAVFTIIFLPRTCGRRNSAPSSVKYGVMRSVNAEKDVACSPQ